MTARARSGWPDPGRGEIRDETLPRIHAGRPAGPDALQRYQPRHRVARFRGRVPPSGVVAACARRSRTATSRPGQVRLLQRRGRRGGPRALQGRHVFVLYPHQTRYVVPAAAAHLLPDDVTAAGPCSPRTSRPPSTACGTRGRTLAIALPSSAPALSAAWWHGWPRASGLPRAARGRQPARAPTSRARSACPSPRRKPPKPDADLVIHASGAPDGLDLALRLAGVKPPSSN